MSCMPRKDSSSSFKVVSGTSLQISPNLEALLQHDELSRRACGSPTSLYHPIAGFAVSLPPPPPRNTTKKPVNPETRVNLKEIRRKKSVNVRSDSWPDALLACNTSVSHSSPAPSRCATPNPFINPTPIMPPINILDARESGQCFYRKLHHPFTHTPFNQGLSLTQNDHASPSETVLPPARRSEPDVRHTPSTRALSSHRSSPTLHKVEKMFSKGRESLSILTSAAIPSGLKPKQDDHVNRRPHRNGLAELSANQSSLSSQLLLYSTLLRKC